MQPMPRSPVPPDKAPVGKKPPKIAPTPQPRVGRAQPPRLSGHNGTCPIIIRTCPILLEYSESIKERVGEGSDKSAKDSSGGDRRGRVQKRTQRRPVRPAQAQAAPRRRAYRHLRRPKQHKQRLNLSRNEGQRRPHGRIRGPQERDAARGAFRRRGPGRAVHDDRGRCQDSRRIACAPSSERALRGAQHTRVRSVKSKNRASPLWAAIPTCLATSPRMTPGPGKAPPAKPEKKEAPKSW